MPDNWRGAVNSHEFIRCKAEVPSVPRTCDGMEDFRRASADLKLNVATRGVLRVLADVLSCVGALANRSVSASAASENVDRCPLRDRRRWKTRSRTRS